MSSSQESAVPPPAYNSNVPDDIQSALQCLDVKTDLAQVERVLCEAIDEVSNELHEISKDLHEHPEISMQEHHAHQLLTDYLEKKGFAVTRKAYDMDTAFTAEFSKGEGRRVGFCSEYDALPNIGHGCGHNCIAISGLACAIAVKKLLEQGLATGKVILFGTPGEERFVGKIVMMKKRAFQDNVDVCLMIHPSAHDLNVGPMTAVNDVTVEFRGKPSHAGQAPWEGVNALDAMLQAWNNISMLRQQIKPTDRIHGIIQEGGTTPNVIVDYSKALFYVRGYKVSDVKRLIEKVENCFKAAAVATGCEATWKWRDLGMVHDVMQNSVLGEMYASFMRKEGVSFPHPAEQIQMLGGSTDFGNISSSVPSLHPLYSMNCTTAANHTTDFAAAAGTKEAFDATIRASKALAVVGAATLVSQTFYDAVRKEFETKVPKEYQ
ncbi:hypothetical protein LRAMOSA09479 [Lichtheimia ramosa]|uniref:Peptidase M20 domain-containing protein 2 n=1 Tax=Lichtheimia ramosa TaxID=688394 RepID=A0A077WGZ1_9FUNG|nr:hypothetical protein LRAMOSA09479 [Lichtheimia ramosa]